MVRMHWANSGRTPGKRVSCVALVQAYIIPGIAWFVLWRLGRLGSLDRTSGVNLANCSIMVSFIYHPRHNTDQSQCPPVKGVYVTWSNDPPNPKIQDWNVTELKVCLFRGFLHRNLCSSTRLIPIDDTWINPSLPISGGPSTLGWWRTNHGWWNHEAESGPGREGVTLYFILMNHFTNCCLKRHVSHLHVRSISNFISREFPRRMSSV